jgi:uncharacterized protein YcnI
MKRLALLIALALGALLALAGPASAHVTVSSTDAAPGGYAVVTFRVPTESATASTTKIVVEVPPLGSVSVQPTPGWTATTKTSKLATPIKTDDGEQTEAISQITWTASVAAAIKPGQFQQFAVSLGPLPKAASIAFPAVQYYSDGTVVKWIEKAAPGSSAEPEHPAPTLSLKKAASSSEPVVKTEKASTAGATALGVVALVVAAAALGLALVTRAKGRTT